MADEGEKKSQSHSPLRVSNNNNFINKRLNNYLGLTALA